MQRSDRGAARRRERDASGDDVAPLHGDDPVAVRLARHATGIGVLVVGAAVMGLVGVFPPSMPWWAPSATLLLGSVLIAVVYARNPGSSRREAHLRAAVQALALTTVTYATGWGFALPFVHLFGISDNINESGSRAGRVSLFWAATVTVVAQGTLELGIVPVTAITVRASHLVAGITLVLLVLVTNRLRAAAEAREVALADLERSERRFRTLIEDSTDVTLLLDEQLTITYASPSIRRVLGLDDDEMVGRRYCDLVDCHADVELERAVAMITGANGGSSLMRYQVRRGDGDLVEVEASHRDLLADVDVEAIVVSVRDVTERVELERAVEHGRHHDVQTGLPIRSTFVDHAAELLRVTGSSGVGVLAVGIEGLDALTKAGGSDVVDEVVAGIARDLAASIRDGHLLARIGENRFGILARRLEGVAAMHTMAERLREVVGRSVAAGDVEVALTARVGMASAEPTVAARDVLVAAELALAAARETPGGIVVFDESLRAGLRAKIAAERELTAAIAAGDQLRLHYQPLVGLDGDAGVQPHLVGVEALVRWQHPVRGLVSPGDFVPLAEETGLIVDVGWWVLDAALAQLAEWDAVLGTGTVGYVSVNVSMLQFAGGELVRRVEHGLDHHGLAPHRLLLELTESALARDPGGAVPQLAVLTGMGVQLAIDDFGTGYSSMAYLQQFPVDVLKIDRAFVSSSSTAHRPELLRSLRQLGDALGLRTVAEGIETAEELAAVRALRFDVAQGYLFGRPVPPSELTAAIRSRQAAGGRADRSTAPSSRTTTPAPPPPPSGDPVDGAWLTPDGV